MAVTITSEQIEQITALPGCSELQQKPFTAEELVTIATRAFTTGNVEMQQLVCGLIGTTLELNRCFGAQEDLDDIMKVCTAVALRRFVRSLGSEEQK